MLFVLALGILLGIAGITLLHQYLSGALSPAEDHAPRELQPLEFPRLAPPRPTLLRATPPPTASPRLVPPRRTVSLYHPRRAA